MSTYVAAAETCPLLVRWAPKCICIHLSRQQRSGWKQNHAQEDTCSWARARALAAAKGSRNWTPGSSHLTLSPWCCDPQQISPNCPNLSFSGPLRSAVRRENWLFLSQMETRQQCSLKIKLQNARTPRKTKNRLGKVGGCSVDLTVVWYTENQSSDSSPALQQMQLCADLPPGAAFCYVPWLALMQGDPCSPQRNSYQLLVLDFSRHHDITDPLLLCPLWKDWIVRYWQRLVMSKMDAVGSKTYCYMNKRKPGKLLSIHTYSEFVLV